MFKKSGLLTALAVLFVFAASLMAPTAAFAAPGGPSWDKSSMSVTGQCEAGVVVFTVTNDGSGDMAGSVAWRLHQDSKDGSVIQSGTVGPLLSGHSAQLLFATSGKVFLEVEQRPGHPGIGEAWASVDVCHQPTPVAATATPTSTSVPPTDTNTPEASPTSTSEVSVTPTTDPCGDHEGDVCQTATPPEPTVTNLPAATATSTTVSVCCEQPPTTEVSPVVVPTQPVNAGGGGGGDDDQDFLWLILSFSLLVIAVVVVVVTCK